MYTYTFRQFHDDKHCVVMSRCPPDQKVKVHHESSGSPTSIAGSTDSTLPPVTPLTPQNQNMI